MTAGHRFPRGLTSCTNSLGIGEANSRGVSTQHPCYPLYINSEETLNSIQLIMLQSISGISDERTPNSSDANSDILFPSSTLSDHDADNSFPGSALRVRAQSRSSARLRHIRSSIGSYNENILSGCARKRRRIDMDSEGHTVAIATSVGADDAEKQLLEEAGQLPRPEMCIGALVEQTAKTLEDEKHDTTRRRSTRLGTLDRATGLVQTTKNLLGKRERDTCTTEFKEVDQRSANGDGSGTSNGTEVLKSEGPVKKRAWLLNKLHESDQLSAPATEPKISRQSRAKRWLSHGLYIGQDESTGSRVSQKASKLNRPSNECSNIKHRKILPMPMFRGHRMIEMGRDFKLPFDIFSPLPPGQTRPEEWKKTHKSESQFTCLYFADVPAPDILVGEAINLWKKAKPLESSQCVCTPQSGCGEECFNRFMFYECDNSNCNIGADHCTNRSFENLRLRAKAGGKYNVGVEVVKTLDRGHGVRSNRCFEPNQIIVEYTGEIITQGECDNRMKNRYRDSEVSHFRYSHLDPIALLIPCSVTTSWTLINI